MKDLGGYGKVSPKLVINIPFVLISSVIPCNAGENYIPDGSGSGSAIVGHLEIPTPTHQPNIRCYLCSINVTKDHNRKHMYGAKSYSVIPNNEKSSHMFSSAHDLVILLLSKKSCMFITPPCVQSLM